MLSKLREPVNGLTHFFTAIAAIIGLIVLLIVGWGDTGRVISLLVYGISLILLFFASGFYHMVKGKPEVITRLRKFDHAAIYLLIAGTYTPLCWNMFTGFWKWGLLSIIWSLAIIGAGIKVFIVRAPRWVNAGVYLIMGWLVISAASSILKDTFTETAAARFHAEDSFGA